VARLALTRAHSAARRPQLEGGGTKDRALRGAGRSKFPPARQRGDFDAVFYPPSIVTAVSRDAQSATRLWDSWLTSERDWAAWPLWCECRSAAWAWVAVPAGLARATPDAQPAGGAFVVTVPLPVARGAAALVVSRPWPGKDSAETLQAVEPAARVRRPRLEMRHRADPAQRRGHETSQGVTLRSSGSRPMSLPRPGWRSSSMARVARESTSTLSKSGRGNVLRGWSISSVEAR